MEEIKLFWQIIKYRPISQLISTMLYSAGVCYTCVQNFPGFSVSLWVDFVMAMVQWPSVNMLKCSIRQC